MRQALAYMAAEPALRFRLSREVQDIASRAHLVVPPNAKGHRFDHVVFFVPGEGPSMFDWPGNDPFAFRRIFGPREVNIEWYPTWWGSPHR